MRSIILTGAFICELIFVISIICINIRDPKFSKKHKIAQFALASAAAIGFVVLLMLLMQK